MGKAQVIRHTRIIYIYARARSPRYDLRRAEKFQRNSKCNFISVSARYFRAVRTSSTCRGAGTGTLKIRAIRII